MHIAQARGKDIISRSKYIEVAATKNNDLVKYALLPQIRVY